MKRRQKSNSELSVASLPETPNLTLKSTLQDLLLYDFQVESSRVGKEVARTFEANPLLPGAILTENGEYIGMISRWRFFEQISRPYGIQLFLKRPIKSLYRLVGNKILLLPGETLIVEAARQSVQRLAKLIYEPIVVTLAPGVYRIADVHQLLVAQSKIHELTTQLLNEQTQAQIRQTEKLATLGRTIAGVGHEIRNPVNCICGNLDFLSKHCKSLVELLSAYEAEDFQRSPQINKIKEEIDVAFLIEDLPKIVATMKVGGDRLKKLIGSLRNFSHMDETNLQPTDIHECIDSTLLILNCHLKSIKVIKNYGDLPLVRSYYSQLSQVFMNIISNAIDALIEKTSNTTNWQPQIEITTQVIERESGNWVAVRIADNGSGMSPEIQARIFETFFTTKPVGKGTGLGLAIAHQIITSKHGGELLVRSHSASSEVSTHSSQAEFQPETGTEFEIRLPLESLVISH